MSNLTSTQGNMNWHNAGETFLLAAFGGVSVGVIQLAEMKDIAAIAVAAVTIVCMVYSTFFKKPIK